MSRQLETAVERLELDLSEGRISLEDFRFEMRELQRDFQAHAEDMARQAYDNTMDYYGY